MDLTVVVPFWNGHETLPALLASIPNSLPVILVNDYQSSTPDTSQWPNVRVLNLNSRGYFSGACNAGFTSCDTDVLILNQDGILLPGWGRALEQRDQYGLIGDAALHPGWPNSYVQGTFMFISRETLDQVGKFNDWYPLWGSTCEFQLRACRQGIKALPFDAAPYFEHARGSERYGSAITQAMEEQPKLAWHFIKTPPEISVIITTHNYERYLEQAVQSILDQTFQSTEIIIVDDGSTDGTPELGKALHDPWKGIHYIRQRNQGASAAANAGIERAKGRHITVLDGDDWMAPTRLEKMLTLAYRNPGAVIYDDMFFIREDGRTGRGLQEYDFETLLHKNHMHKGILYPKKAWTEVGGYANEMDDGREDWEFNVNLGLHGWCGVHLQEALYMYRRQHQGRSQRIPRYRGYFKRKIIKLHPDVYNKGVRPMACCGKRASPKPTASPKVSIQRTPAVSTAPDPTWVELQYSGSNIGNQTIYGPSRTRYKYGRNARRLRFWAHPDDVEFLMNTNRFNKVVVKSEPAPKPVPAPEPELIQIPVEDAPAVPKPVVHEQIILATNQAKKLASEAGVLLEEISHEGDKIGVADVRAYIAETQDAG